MKSCMNSRTAVRSNSGQYTLRFPKNQSIRIRKSTKNALFFQIRIVFSGKGRYIDDESKKELFLKKV